MKHEWKKHEKDLYLPKDKPVLITVPEQKFFMINGKGNPNGEDFAERVSVLYSLAYAVRMMPKQGMLLPVILNILFTRLKEYGIYLRKEENWIRYAKMNWSIQL